jgi:hypothetical protein
MNEGTWALINAIAAAVPIVGMIAITWWNKRHLL